MFKEFETTQANRRECLMLYVFAGFSALALFLIAMFGCAFYAYLKSQNEVYRLQQELAKRHSEAYDRAKKIGDSSYRAGFDVAASAFIASALLHHARTGRQPLVAGFDDHTADGAFRFVKRHGEEAVDWFTANVVSFDASFRDEVRNSLKKRTESFKNPPK